MWMLGTEPGYSGRGPVLLIIEPSLYPWKNNFTVTVNDSTFLDISEHRGLGQKDKVASPCLKKKKQEERHHEDFKNQCSIADMVNQTRIPVQRSQEDPEFQASLHKETLYQNLTA